MVGRLKTASVGSVGLYKQHVTITLIHFESIFQFSPSSDCCLSERSLQSLNHFWADTGNHFIVLALTGQHLVCYKVHVECTHSAHWKQRGVGKARARPHSPSARSGGRRGTARPPSAGPPRAPPALSPLPVSTASTKS